MEQIYTATPAPRSLSNPLVPINRLEPIERRFEDDNRYARKTIEALLAFNEYAIDDWADEKSDEEATVLVEGFFSDATEETPQESLLYGINDLLEDFDVDSSNLHPALALMAKEIFFETVKSLTEISEDGTVTWRGDYGQVIPMMDVIFVASEESTSKTFDAITLIADSQVFTEPFSLF